MFCRKIISAALAGALLLTFTACNAGGDEWLSEDVVVGTQIVTIPKDGQETAANGENTTTANGETDKQGVNGEKTDKTVSGTTAKAGTTDSWVTTGGGQTRTRRSVKVTTQRSTKRIAKQREESIVDLVVDGRARLIGRQALTSNAVVMDYNNATIRLYGELEGVVKMNVSNTSSTECRIHVVIDGDYKNSPTIVIDKNDYVVELCKDLKKGMHTIDIIRSTCCDWRSLEIYSITYKGFLEKAPASDLQIEFLGDSITCAVGAIKADGGYDLGSKWQDGFYSYAAITARNLKADASVLSLSGRTTAQVYEKFNDVRSDQDDNNWNFAANQQDIVVINLGTNDYIFGVNAATVKAAVNGLLTDIRKVYSKNTYIIWAYGMMTDVNLSTYKSLVTNYAADHNDNRVLFCDLSSVKNTEGWSFHPNEKGQQDAAEVLTAFIRKNCKGVL